MSTARIILRVVWREMQACREEWLVGGGSTRLLAWPHLLARQRHVAQRAWS